MAVSTINKDFLVKTYSVSTTTNSGVSPFGAYADKKIDEISGYTPYMVDLEGTGSTNPSSARIYGTEGVFVWTKSAVTLGLRVLYIKN